MQLKSFVVRNFRRLKKVWVDLSGETTIFVGANNSGKTSATQIFQLFMAEAGKFTIHDFSADCWIAFNAFEAGARDGEAILPSIDLDLWFDVDESNLHRVIDLLPDLDWKGKPVGVRISFEPKDAAALFTNYLEARPTAGDKSGQPETRDDTYKPWPRNLFDYLSKRLDAEYQVAYYKLDADKLNETNELPEAYVPLKLAEGARIVNSVIKVDFLDAQRYLSDNEVRGRSEDLSRRLSRFYLRNLQKRDPDVDALRALAESENRLNEHYAGVFAPMLGRLEKLGYPGLANPKLVVRANIKADSLLSGNSAQVHYAVAGIVPDAESSAQITLPDRYNGLGFKNLIYMVVELVDFHHAWIDMDEKRPPVHIVMIEEPETHLHAQLQQVFVRHVREILGEVDGCGTQLIITTHSSHVVYEDFRFIRYFCRLKRDDDLHYTDVKNLSNFYELEEPATRDFLLQYLKLTHCDLFFADAAILVEGNVERLLLPLIIARSSKVLTGSHLTILEVGGAFAHKFRQLIEFLGIPCLIITDIDSMALPLQGDQDVDEECLEDAEFDTDPEVESASAPPVKRKPNAKACLTDVPGAYTSNETLKQWIPKLEMIEDLLDLPPESKVIDSPGALGAAVRVAFQTRQTVSWSGCTREIAGRTFEESFAFSNLAWCQEAENQHIGLRVSLKVRQKGIDGIIDAIFMRVRAFDKTRFALALMDSKDETWMAPAYIVEGLEWLASRLGVVESKVAVGTASLQGESE
ncbi:ATP-dependent endonuclease [Lentzea sp. NPDC051213]|uniref:ATP-dependent endonuclease n=1 Tax=Lentzea sp. NPDC051213 TaxID=3364126 RepID=UPI0037B2429B